MGRGDWGRRHGFGCRAWAHHPLCSVNSEAFSTTRPRTAPIPNNLVVTAPIPNHLVVTAPIPNNLVVTAPIPNNLVVTARNILLHDRVCETKMSPRTNGTAAGPHSRVRRVYACVRACTHTRACIRAAVPQAYICVAQVLPPSTRPLLIRNHVFSTRGGSQVFTPFFLHYLIV